MAQVTQLLSRTRARVRYLESKRFLLAVENTQLQNIRKEYDLLVEQTKLCAEFHAKKKNFDRSLERWFKINEKFSNLLEQQKVDSNDVIKNPLLSKMGKLEYLNKRDQFRTEYKNFQSEAVCYRSDFQVQAISPELQPTSYLKSETNIEKLTIFRDNPKSQVTKEHFSPVYANAEKKNKRLKSRIKKLDHLQTQVYELISVEENSTQNTN